jgi:hypothetical protein
MEPKPLKKVTPEIMALWVSVRDFAESGYGGYTESPEKIAARWARWKARADAFEAEKKQECDQAYMALNDGNVAVNASFNGKQLRTLDGVQ